MKKYFKISISILLILICYMVYFYQTIGPEELVKHHFKLQNQNAFFRIKATVTPRHLSTNWNLNNIDEIKLLNIEEDTTGKIAEDYNSNGMGSTKNYQEVKGYVVTYALKNKVDGKSPLYSGEYNFNYVTVKKNRFSRWLIDDWGI
ncbi:DUF4829 domain-containing protein [Alkaliphilus transvaalensis]|uniref:DUF4829 domain-containing protein n=1 Tax=Alkaliphilus transvaalensis TaxID=114628 RepID=UPI00047C517C|nr:DUF4829 domain-containing protein [Alkaliphilus transvaalensis]